MCCRNKQRAVVHPRQAGAEPAVEAALVVLSLDLLLLLLPVDAEGRVAEEVVEGLGRELVLGEDVAEADVVAAAVVAHLLHEHVGGRRGEGALVVVLPVGVELRLGVVLAQVALRLGQHAARAARRVEQLAHRAGRGEQLVVVDEEQVDHEADHLAGREVIAGRLVREFVEAADEVLEDEPHLLVRHVRRVEVDVGELRDHEVEDVRLVHLLDLGLELEVLEDALDVGREALDVADQVLVDVVGVALQLREVERRAVVEALARDLVQRGVERVAGELAAFVLLVGRDHLGLRPARTQSKRRSTVIGSITRSYCGGRYGPRRRSAICQMRFAKLLWSAAIGSRLGGTMPGGSTYCVAPLASSAGGDRRTSEARHHQESRHRYRRPQAGPSPRRGCCW
jgi:hypothetical protein